MGFFKKHRDFFQNILIVALVLSAVFLFVQTQLNYVTLGEPGYFSQLIKPVAQESDSAPLSALTDLSAPVHIAVTGAYGRYGSVSMTTTEDSFFPLSTLLREVLGSAKSFTRCDAVLFQGSLAEDSVYYDFLSALPLSVLSGLVGGSVSESEISARSLVVCLQGDQVLLCIWDGAQTYLRSTSAVPAEDFTQIVGNYELNGAFFAMDAAESSPAYAGIFPLSLFPADLPDEPILSAVSPLSDTAALLVAFGFNPYTETRYMESGTEVILEGDQSLHLHPDGTLFYQSDSASALQIEAGSGTLSDQETILGALSLIYTLLPSVGGDASLYLQSFSRSDSEATLSFGYQFGGTPIRVSGSTSAVIMTLSGSSVLSLQILCRQYTAGTELSHLLPLRQALAIAATYGGIELAMRYIDEGDGTVYAGWIAD